MNVFIMTDLEGVAGVYNWEDYCNSGSRYYDYSRHLLTEEVNAAVRGFFSGGASTVRVQIGHNVDSILAEDLDERATLVNDHHLPIWPWGLDDSPFDALAFVGQHAKAGTSYSHMTHTGNLGTLDQRVNGLSIGEYGALALCAMELGIPTIFAAGEEALCREAEALTPGVITVAGKRGLIKDEGRTRGLTKAQYETANLGAEHKSPKLVRKLLEEGAKEAIRKLIGEGKESFHYPKLDKPYYVVREYRAGCGSGGTEKRPFALVCENSSFIAGMNGLYDSNTPEIRLEQVLR